VVARERRDLALTEALPLERVRAFVAWNVADDAIQFFALDGERVVDWADVLPGWGHALRQCGTLGMRAAAQAGVKMRGQCLCGGVVFEVAAREDSSAPTDAGRVIVREGGSLPRRARPGNVPHASAPTRRGSTRRSRGPTKCPCSRSTSSAWTTSSCA